MTAPSRTLATVLLGAGLAVVALGAGAQGPGDPARGRAVFALVRKARGVHNPSAAEALLQAARQKADEAAAQAGRR